jgi:osmotically-inducible protein OsmY
MKTDQEILRNILNELKWLPFNNRNRFDIRVKDGVVTITGSVETYSQKIRVEETVLKLAGVRSISQEKQIEVAQLNKKDTDIAQSVLDALKWPIRVKVEEGAITLEGQVEWYYQRESAKKVVADLVGSRDINNLVVVKPRITSADIKQKITTALHRMVSVDASGIEVEITGNVVKLRGRVRSLAEKLDAAVAAQGAPGIIRVDNFIQVEQPADLVLN